jgi:hypothetical protein
MRVKPPEQIHLVSSVPDTVVRAMEGRYPDEGGYTRAVRHPADVYRPNGSLLFKLRKRPPEVLAAAVLQAYPELVRLAREQRDGSRRVVASGGAAEFYSGAAGALHGKPVSFARRTADRRRWVAMHPLARELAAVLARECPEQYAVMSEAAARTPAGLVVPGAPFTTLTANHWSGGAVTRNARMACHKDRRNLPGGLGVMVWINTGAFDGGHLVFPKFEVAVSGESLDVLIADTGNEYHGNTAVASGEEWERVTAVLFFHASNLPRGGR